MTFCDVERLGFPGFQQRRFGEETSCRDCVAVQEGGSQPLSNWVRSLDTQTGPRPRWRATQPRNSARLWYIDQPALDGGWHVLGSPMMGGSEREVALRLLRVRMSKLAALCSAIGLDCKVHQPCSLSPIRVPHLEW